MKKFTFIVFLFYSVTVFGQLDIDNAIHNGQSRLYFGNYLGAIESFNMVLKFKPYLPEPYYFRGVAKLELDDYRGALTDLNKAIEIKPYYPEAIMYRGFTNYKLNDFKSSMDDYSKALELGGENADLYNNRGLCKAAMKDFDGAIADYTHSIELKAKNFNAYLNRSIAYQIQKEWDKAISDCNQLIRIKPNSPMGYMSRGLIKIEKKDYASALRDFDAAISFDPRNAFAYQNRGMVKQELESYESAIMDYDAAINIDPYMASAYFNRAIAKEMIGRKDYQKDYDKASLLDQRFSKKPWQTEEERQKAQQQQLQAWKQQNQSKNIPADSVISEIDSTSISDKTEYKIDMDELRKRKLKASLALEDNREMPGSDNNEEGKLQDKNIDIKLLPDFQIANINKNLTDNEDIGYFNLVIENLNAANNYDPYLTITDNPAETQLARDYYKNQVLIFNEKIDQNKNISNNYFYRGIFESLLGDYNNSIKDLDQSIKLDERNLPAYFMRAVTRTGLAETIQNQKTGDEATGLLKKDFDILSGNSKSNIADMSAYNDILTDYSVILYMNPDFIFAYYNRGNLYCKSEKYFQAIEEYSKAISIEPEFAEAYYNRGLIKILINNTEDGAKDLSKAGELGIGEAYNVIKRYCN